MRAAPQFLSKENRPLGLVCLLLGLITAACYWPITKHGFVILDDPTYIYLNSHIKPGLTWAGIAWAFTTGYASNWHPLTWISHMLDCQIYGFSPGGHHFTNLLLHAINSVLLFLLLRQMTGGAFWRSAFVAALFAWHPLHVESVAWAAERKDVLSTLFFLLTLWAYHKYCSPPVPIRAPASWTAPVLWRFITPPATGTPSTLAALPTKSGRGLPQSKTFGVASRWYLLALLLFSLGLMSKPMLVTLPCVLLLLDFWPLNRLRTAAQRNAGVSPAGSGGVSPPSQHRYCPDGLWPLLREKIPFFALSFAASVVTFLVQRGGGAVSSLVTVPFSLRVSNALLAYVRYISKTLVPVDLSVFYPLPEHWPILAVAGAGLLLLVWSILFFRWSGRYPYLLVGWLWFLGTLVPTIGLVQVGSQSMADRYMYIPSIGLFLMIVWGTYDTFGLSWCRTEESATRANTVSRAFSLSPSEGERAGERGPIERAPSVCSSSHGPPSKRLLPLAGFAVVLACLSCTSLQIGYWRDEETLFRHAMEVTQDNYLAYDHLAQVCQKDGRTQEALAFYTSLVHLKPHYPQGQYNLGGLLLGLGRLDEAALHLRSALQDDPAFAAAHCDLGIVFFRQNKLPEAAGQLETAVQLNPKDPDFRCNLGLALMSMGRLQDAATCFSSAVQLKPEAPETHFLLALALKRENLPDQAIPQAQKARDLALASGQKQAAQKAEEFLSAEQAPKAEAILSRRDERE